MNNQSNLNNKKPVEGNKLSTDNTAHPSTLTYTSLKAISAETTETDTPDDVIIETDIDEEDDEEYVQSLYIHPDAMKESPTLPPYIQKNGTTHPYDKSWFISRLFQYMTHAWLYPVVKYGMSCNAQLLSPDDNTYKKTNTQKRIQK